MATETMALQRAEQAQADKGLSRWTPQHAQEVRLPTPEAVNYMVAVSNLLAGGALWSKDLGENTQEAKANAMAKMLTGWEWAMSPMESLRVMYIVKGKVTMDYSKMLEIMLSSGIRLKWVRNSADGCELYGRRKARHPGEEDYEYTATWGPEDTKRAGLDRPSRTGEPSNHTKIPKTMFEARCISQMFRKMGIGPRVYTPEEALAIPDEDQDFTAETIAEAAGTAESKDIDETVIRPEDEADLRKTYGIYGLGPKAATAKLLEIQAEVREKSGGNPDWAQQAIRAEVSRVMAESQKASIERGKRRRKPSASEQAAEEAPGQAVNGHAQEATAAEPEPPADEELGVSPEDVPQSAAAQQGSLGEDW